MHGLFRATASLLACAVRHRPAALGRCMALVAEALRGLLGALAACEGAPSAAEQGSRMQLQAMGAEVSRCVGAPCAFPLSACRACTSFLLLVAGRHTVGHWSAGRHIVGHWFAGRHIVGH